MKLSKIKNTWRKSRKADNPYYEITTRDGWNYKVLKMNHDPRKPFASAFCIVTTPMTGSSGDMGDTYVTEVPGLVAAWIKAHTPPKPVRTVSSDGLYRVNPENGKEG